MRSPSYGKNPPLPPHPLFLMSEGVQQRTVPSRFSRVSAGSHGTLSNTICSLTLPVLPRFFALSAAPFYSYPPASLTDGRVAMLACVGWFVAEFVHLPHPRLSNPVALDAAREIPRGLWATIIIGVSLAEILTFNKMLESDRRAGDLDFDPLKLDSPAMRLREVKHGRLAMLSIRTF